MFVENKEVANVFYILPSAFCSLEMFAWWPVSVKLNKKMRLPLLPSVKETIVDLDRISSEPRLTFSLFATSNRALAMALTGSCLLLAQNFFSICTELVKIFY